MNCCSLIVLLTLLVGANISTIAPKNKSSKKVNKASTAGNNGVKKEPKFTNLAGSAAETQTSKLAPEDLCFEEMLGQNMTSVTVRESVYDQTVLGYVTPWHNKGYDHAKFLGSKFDLISPVWYQVRRLNGKVEFGGLQDTDYSWIQEVRASNPAVKIVPRLLFDGWKAHDLSALFSGEMSQTAVVEKIVNFVKEHPFDGIVCEILLQVGYSYKLPAMHLLAHLGGALKQHRLQLIVPLPAPLRSDGTPNMFFTVDDFKRLSPVVDYFNIMTYDYTTGPSPGPVSPASWITSCILFYTKDLPAVERSRFLMGVNFYGYKYKSNQNTPGEPIIANGFLELLNKYNSKTKVLWDENAMEHLFQFGPNEKVYFPTLHSIKLRLQLAEKLGVGVGIWDLGQGLDHFLNLF